MVQYCHLNGNNFLSVLRCRSYFWWFRTRHSAPFFFSRFRTGAEVPTSGIGGQSNIGSWSNIILRISVSVSKNDIVGLYYEV